MNRRGLLLGAALCVAACLASLGTKQVTAADPNLTAQVEGVFPRDGHMHGEPLADAAGVRQWGSLAGAESNTGAVALGPFAAPARLRFGVTGFPAQAGSEVAIELVATGEKTRVPLPVDIGARWNIVDFDPPPAWVGQPIKLVARDGTPTTWIGITEPIRGGRGEGLNGLRQTFASWIVNGFLLGLLWLAALRWLRQRSWLGAAWQPLLAGAAVAVMGYLAFWIYFAHASAGRCFSVALLVGAAVYLFRQPATGPLDPETKNIARLLVAIGAFYLALLHLYPSSREFDALAANRFKENLPGDNTLPYNLASALYAGHPTKGAQAGYYQASDRPPLQTGWLLLTWPATGTLGFDGRGASGTAAVWLQLLWIPAVYGLLRTLRLTAGRAAAWIAVMALSGFFLQHTVFTWPKLAAGAFTCGAFALWILPAPDETRRARVAIGSLFAALAWLSHGGVAFSLLAMAPWLAWQALRGAWRDWLVAVAVFLLLALPWLGYQKLYDPPANLLMKEHLAGVEERDARGTWTAMRDSYRAAEWSLTLTRKKMNFTGQVAGEWRQMFDFSAAGAAARRKVEFFHTLRALAWWTLALPLLGLAFARAGARRQCAALWRAHASLLGWAVLTTILWCLLMFHGGHAVIHQGSYALLLTLFVLAATWLELAGRWTLWLVAALQAATLATTYAVSNPIIHGPALGWPLVAVTGAVVAWLMVKFARANEREEAQP